MLYEKNQFDRTSEGEEYIKIEIWKKYECRTSIRIEVSNVFVPKVSVLFVEMLFRGLGQSSMACSYYIAIEIFDLF